LYCTTGFPAESGIALATYSIDNQEPITFSVQSHSDIINDLPNQMLFNAGPLSLGQHKLVVKYLGSNSTIPINFNYLVQQDGPSSTSSNTHTPTSTNVLSGTSSTPTSTSVPSGTDSSPSTIHMKPTEDIIGGVIGGVVLISLLLALFIFLRRRNTGNRRSQPDSQALSTPFTVPSWSPTSTFLAQEYTLNGQPSQPTSRKFTQKRGQPSDHSSASSSGGIPPFKLTLLRPQFSTSPPRLSLTGLQTNLDGTRTRVPQATTEPSIQRSPSPQGANARFLRHEDSGVRIPSAEDDVVELPPFYTPE
jgi:hypothetical protein